MVQIFQVFESGSFNNLTRLLPSSFFFVLSDAPAISVIVGNKSNTDAICLTSVPGFMPFGHRISNGDRVPPSSVEPSFLPYRHSSGFHLVRYHEKTQQLYPPPL